MVFAPRRPARSMFTPTQVAGFFSQPCRYEFDQIILKYHRSREHPDYESLMLAATVAKTGSIIDYEKYRIVKAHEYFTNEEKAGRTGGVGTRERVVACLYVGVSTVARVIAHWNKNPRTKFDEPRETKRTDQSKCTSLELRGVIREFVIAENESTRPITAQLISTQVANVMNKQKRFRPEICGAF
ncbi:hypothetical protein JG687_00014290 [Phytophthora cactorum]|uniref:Uncharacterized protein n=1 Tax=Phytophthora cactorum TaxID=29920 RepID=A0A8T1TXA9_9STRA|nr:hypothetical protein JG687_00014290 [Phytophthora cactorum]